MHIRICAICTSRTQFTLFCFYVHSFLLTQTWEMIKASRFVSVQQRLRSHHRSRPCYAAYTACEGRHFSVSADDKCHHLSPSSENNIWIIKVKVSAVAVVRVRQVRPDVDVGVWHHILIQLWRLLVELRWTLTSWATTLVCNPAANMFPQKLGHLCHCCITEQLIYCIWEVLYRDEPRSDMSYYLHLDMQHMSGQEIILTKDGYKATELTEGGPQSWWAMQR